MAAYELCFVVLENCTYMFNKINCMSVEMLQSLYFSQSYIYTNIHSKSFPIWCVVVHKGVLCYMESCHT
jgi:hypothetical protein